MSDASTGAMQNFRGSSLSKTVAPHPGLVLLYAEGYGALPASIVLPKQSIVLGRDASADIPLPVTAVSRRHAEIQFQKGAFYVRDLGSTNGTLVDGQRVEEALLEPNGELRLGDVIFKFVERGAEEHADYLIDGRMRPGATRATKSASALVGGLQMDLISAALEQVAPSELSVLILGESGTGKEVAARELHEKSQRKGPFSAVNCAALPDNLIESELFGYKKGAFSGADRDKVGLIQAAHGGTLLLDEIGDMPAAAQAKLLRVLQAKEVVPVGATRPEPVNVRVVAATHRDLGRMQKEGRFRRDLFARLNEFSIILPPLRDRKEDIFQLARFFLSRHGRAELAMSFPFVAGLLHHDWPYNVRELESAIKRAAALVEGTNLKEEHLPESVQQAILDYATGPRPSTPSEIPTEERLRELLQQEAGNVAAVGRKLGKARMQIHRWMNRYRIEVEDFR
jgi:transcriptional regulator with PAS, ATPase and Fis domain